MRGTDALHTLSVAFHDILQAQNHISGCSIDAWPSFWLQG